MKFEGYDQLNMTQKDQFSKISNKLLSHCFICRDIEKDKSDYYFIERNSNLFETYFSLIDWEVDLDYDNGVAHLINLQNRNRYNFKLLESIILLTIRLIYHEKRQELNQTNDIIMTMDELHVKLNTFSMQNRLVDKTSILSAMRLFRQFHLIEMIDKDLTDSESRIKLYPSLIKAIKVDDIRKVVEKLESYKGDKGGLDETFEEDEIY